MHSQVVYFRKHRKNPWAEGRESHAAKRKWFWAGAWITIWRTAQHTVDHSEGALPACNLLDRTFVNSFGLVLVSSVCTFSHALVNHILSNHFAPNLVFFENLQKTELKLQSMSRVTVPVPAIRYSSSHRLGSAAWPGISSATNPGFKSNSE